MSIKITLLSGAAMAALVAATSPAAAGCNAEPYLGSICFTAVSYCTAEYLPADGKLLDIRKYQALYAVLGNRYGGDGSNTFALPDLRGRFPVGTGAGQSPTLTNVTLGQKRGAETVTLNPTQAPVGAHTHVAVFSPTTGPSPVTIPATTGSQTVNGTVQVSTAAATTTVPTLANGNTAYLANAATSSGSITLKGLYTTTAPTTGNIATIPVGGTVTGTPSTPAQTVNVTAVTGGTVAVANNAVLPATKPVDLLNPGLGLTACVAVTGLFPPNPN